jgi:hypothetical protein
VALKLAHHSQEHCEIGAAGKDDSAFAGIHEDGFAKGIAKQNSSSQPCEEDYGLLTVGHIIGHSLISGSRSLAEIEPEDQKPTASDPIRDGDHHLSEIRDKECRNDKDSYHKCNDAGDNITISEDIVKTARVPSANDLNQEFIGPICLYRILGHIYAIDECRAHSIVVRGALECNGEEDSVKEPLLDAGDLNILRKRTAALDRVNNTLV